MSIYIKFIESKKKESLLSHPLEVLLIAICKYNRRGIKVRCTDLIVRKEFGSPATIHKNYQTLLREGYLSLADHEKDRRIKYIRLSGKGIDYFKSMDRLIKKIANMKEV